MSLNTAHANGGVLIYNGELILLYSDGVELIFEGPDTKSFGGSRKGRIYLTTHRMIFSSKSEKDALQSFSFPFFSMSKLELEQPVFGANYIKGIVNAEQGGNWQGQGVFKLKFFSGGAIEFGQAMLKAAEMARQFRSPEPPMYFPMAGPFYPAPPPAYSPPAGGINGFVPPTHMFPDAPPPNSVYTSDMPPPYPGIYPGNQQPYTQPGYPGSQPGYPQAGYPTQQAVNGQAPAPGFVNAGPSAPPPPYGAAGYGQPNGAAGYGQPNGAAGYGQPNGAAGYGQPNGANGYGQPGAYGPGAPSYGLPPLGVKYVDPHDQQILYAAQNAYPNGPPPPYESDKKDK